MGALAGTRPQAPTRALAAGAWLRALGFALIALAAGCAGSVRSASTVASQAATPVIIDESLASFEDPANRQRVAAILGTPEMQQAIREAARAAVGGALELGSAMDLRDQLRSTSVDVADAVSEAIAADVRDKIMPAAADGIRAALQQGLSNEDTRALHRAVNEAVGLATAAAIRSAAEEVPASLGPSLRGAVVDSLNAPEFRAAVSGVLSDTTRAALVSSHDLIVELRAEGEKGPLDRAFDRIERMLLAAVGAAFLIGIGIGGLVVFGVRGYRWRKGSGGGGGAMPPQSFEAMPPQSFEAMPPQSFEAMPPHRHAT